MLALVLEAVPEEVGRIVTERLTIPTIGIGAGRATNEQVIVLNDLLGVVEQFQPRFVKRYAHIGRETAHAVGGYSGDVRSRSFPAAEHCYTMSADELRDAFQILKHYPTSSSISSALAAPWLAARSLRVARVSSGGRRRARLLSPAGAPRLPCPRRGATLRARPSARVVRRLGRPDETLAVAPARLSA
jgi:hypothetical protein